MIAVAHSTKVFCVGQAKSGTASLAGHLRRDFRTAHEPEREATIDLVVARARGDFESVDFGEVLVERDRRAPLDVYRCLKEAYAVRSAFVHGGQMSEKKTLRAMHQRRPVSACGRHCNDAGQESGPADRARPDTSLNAASTCSTRHDYCEGQMGTIGNNASRRREAGDDRDRRAGKALHRNPAVARPKLILADESTDDRGLRTQSFSELNTQP